MGKRTHTTRSSKTLPPSPTHSSSSSSDFEFTISVSPRISSTLLCPADELFYKGQLLPLHLSPRISMVRTLLLASSSTSSSSDTTTTASRDSTGSSSSSFISDVGCDSSRPSSVADLDDEFKKLNYNNCTDRNANRQIKKSKYNFSLLKLSSVFKIRTRDPTRDPARSTNIEDFDNGWRSNNPDSNNLPGPVKKMSATAKEVIRKYFKKVKPLYEKISTKQKIDVLPQLPSSSTAKINSRSVDFSTKSTSKKEISHSFSGNLRYPRRRSCVSSCPSSMRSSPSHSGVLTRNNGFNGRNIVNQYDTVSSSMEELQSAIQGAIAHCKNSMMIQSSTAMVSNEV